MAVRGAPRTATSSHFFENVDIKKADIMGLGGISAILSPMYGRENRGTSDIDSYILRGNQKKVTLMKT